MTEQIIQILERVTDHKGIRTDTDLLEEDILDSLALIELMNELEIAFQVEVQPTQVPSETWQTAERIAEMVEALRKRERKPL